MSSFNPVDILLVEDNPSDAELMLRSLKKRNLANRLHWVQDGVEALDFIFRRDKWDTLTILPKVVFLDLKLPKLNGLEVLEQLKEHEATQSIPVVVVTSSAEDPDIEAAYKLGANSYVVKPVNFDAFADTISNLGFYWLMINQASANHLF